MNWLLHYHVIQGGGSERAVVVAGQRQADVHAGAHAEGDRRADLGPGAAVRRLMGGERIAGAGQLHPVRRFDGGAGGDRGTAPGAGPADEAYPVARGQRHQGMAGVGVQILANHHAGLGEAAGVGQAGDAGHDAAVAGQRLVSEVEGVGTAPDVGARALQREGAVRVTGAPDDSHISDVPTL